MLTRDRRIAAACALAALATSGFAVLASIAPHGWSTSVLVRMADVEPLARLASQSDPNFRFVSPGAHFDGVYFYAIARDPLARGEAHELIDRSAYRYGHVGYGWLAWLFSLGRGETVPGALLTVNLFALAAAAFASSLISRDYGWTPWGGLAIAFSPGILYTVTVDTSEPLGVAAIALALLAWIRGRWGPAAVALVAACLIKEPFVVVPASLALWEAIEWARARRPSDLGRRAAALAAGPLAFAAWQVYLRATFGELSFSGGREETTLLPFTGWWDTLDKAATLGVGDFGASQFGLAQVPLLVAAGGFVLLGVFLALRVRTPFDTLYLFLAVILFSLTWRGLLFPKDLIRHLAVPIAVAPAVFAAALRPPPRPAA
ncbi:MAG TPA: hypothetical protein VK278_03315 [Gaiellaceae bacterium]|nr:hypothetical protein [Gaiellaceae bacterium]